jgi:hypothetical protein
MEALQGSGGRELAQAGAAVWYHGRKVKAGELLE